MAKIEIVKDEKHMARFFRSHLNEFFPGAKSLEFFYGKYFHFLSKESFLMKYELDLKLKSGRTETRIVRGNRVKPSVYKIMSYLRQSFSHKEKGLIPRPLFYFDRLNYILYEELAGVVLRELDSRPNYLIAAIPQAAANLALIHNLPARPGNSHHFQKEKAFLKTQLDKIKHYYPAASKRANQLAGQLLKRYRYICQKDYLTLTHGDFQPSNIIYNLRTKKIGIIDFSASEIFAPANDLAIFLTHLEAMEKHLLPYQKIKQMENIFLKNYFAQANKKNRHLVKIGLGFYQARTCLDIIATTLVFVGLNISPQFLSLINFLFKRADENLKQFDRLNYKNK